MIRWERECGGKEMLGVHNYPCKSILYEIQCKE